MMWTKERPPLAAHLTSYRPALMSLKQMSVFSINSFVYQFQWQLSFIFTVVKLMISWSSLAAVVAHLSADALIFCHLPFIRKSNNDCVEDSAECFTSILLFLLIHGLQVNTPSVAWWPGQIAVLNECYLSASKVSDDKHGHSHCFNDNDLFHYVCFTMMHLLVAVLCLSWGMGRVHQGQVTRFCRAPEKEKQSFALVLTHTMDWHN